MTEKELIQKICEKDEKAFRYLLDTEQLRVFRICLGFLHNKEDAEDVAQEVFIEVIKSIGKFRSDSKVSTWLYRIAINKCLTFLRKNKKNNFLFSISNMLNFQEPVNQQQPHSMLENKERLEEITFAIDSLPENQRIAYTLAKYDDLSYQEIAEVMNVSVSAVESLMHRAKTGLQQKLLKLYKEN